MLRAESPYIGSQRLVAGAEGIEKRVLFTASDVGKVSSFAPGFSALIPQTSTREVFSEEFVSKAGP
jgi:hypothetical protein